MYYGLDASFGVVRALGTYTGLKGFYFLTFGGTAYLQLCITELSSAILVNKLTSTLCVLQGCSVCVCVC